MADESPETLETRKHITRVRQLLSFASDNLHLRGRVHDASKLEPPEADLFAKLTPKLKGTTYGADEYKALLVELKPALDHHYANNSHHPEHYPNGIDGMDLFDLVEMFLDWKAATERHADGNLTRSIEINQKRFGMSDQLCNILRNTIETLERA